MKKFPIKADIPTSIEWFNETKFICGHVYGNKLNVYDIESGKNCKEYTYSGK